MKIFVQPEPVRVPTCRRFPAKVYIFLFVVPTKTLTWPSPGLVDLGMRRQIASYNGRDAANRIHHCAWNHHAGGLRYLLRLAGTPQADMLVLGQPGRLSALSRIFEPLPSLKRRPAVGAAMGKIAAIRASAGFAIGLYIHWKDFHCIPDFRDTMAERSWRSCR